MHRQVAAGSNVPLMPDLAWGGRVVDDPSGHAVSRYDPEGDIVDVRVWTGGAPPSPESKAAGNLGDGVRWEVFPSSAGWRGSSSTGPTPRRACACSSRSARSSPMRSHDGEDQ